MSPESWKVVASLGGVLIGLFGILTGPMIWAVRSEGKMVRLEITNLETRLKAEMTAMEARLNERITATEGRLNERIDTRLVHR